MTTSLAPAPANGFLRAFTLGRLPAASRRWVAVAAVAAHIVIFIIIRGHVDDESLLGVLSAGTIGWLFGWRWGIAAGVAATPLDIVVEALSGGTPDEPLVRGGLDAILVVLSGVLAGGLGTLVRKLDVERARLAEAEARTRDVTMSRDVSRRLLVDTIRHGRVPETARREVGRAFANDISAASLDEAVAAFRGLGLGDLRFVGMKHDRFVVQGHDLIERSSTKMPSCILTLSFLEASVSRTSGERALGAETECESTGAPACRFEIALRHDE